MATYSTNLALTLITTGDEAGTWGTTTNTNLGTLLEQAISGYVTQAVATGTDTTITIPNGTTGVARNMFLELTGTAGASTNLIVPANKKLYFIYNNATSGAVTVKVSGQTGVSVPYGAKMALVCNGTDIVESINAAGSFTTAGTSTATKFVPTGTSATGNGMYLPAANQLGFSTNGVARMTISSTGGVTIAAPTSGVALNLNNAASAIQLAVGNWDAMRYVGSALEIGGLTASQFTGLSFYTGGTQRMSISSTGAIAQATSAVVYKSTTGATTGGSAYNVVTSGGTYYVGTESSAGGVLAVGSSAYAFVINAESARSIQFGTTNTVRTTITAAGKVGINVAAPNALLSVSAASATGSSIGDGMRVNEPTGGYGVNIGGNSSGYAYIQGLDGIASTGGANNLQLQPIGGGVVVGGTTGALYGTLQVYKAGATAFGIRCGLASAAPQTVWASDTSGNNYFIEFATEGTYTPRGSITYNRAGNLTAYNTTSDYRLKEHIVDLPNALETVNKLKPRQFDWKETGITTTGFIAHELFEVCPHAVTGEKDATVMREYEVSPLVPATFDEEGKELTAEVAAVTGEHEVPRYQGVDTSFLVATLVKAIQEQQAIIESLTVRIATLESK